MECQPNTGSAVRRRRPVRQADAYAEAERYLTDWERLSGSTEASKLEWMLLGAQQGDFAGQEDHLQLLVKENHPDSTAILLALARGCSVCYRRREATQT